MSQDKQDKKTYIVAFHRDPIEKDGKSRAELSQIFHEQTNSALVKFKDALKSENIEQSTDIKNVLPNMGMLVVETTPENIAKIDKMPMVRMTMENQKVYIPRPRGPNNQQ